MESYQLKDVTFQYPTRETPALGEINLSISQGEFITFCGSSGSGKTTLLRLLKPLLAPFGRQTGSILFQGEPLSSLSHRQESQEIGFVLQSPEHQIVTDKVWHELAFGLESLGVPSSKIRSRVSEMASFFGIEDWFHQKTATLSGGQKQLLNLASVMVMQPSVLILDEPTSQLDPIGATTFLDTLKRINRELGTTILLSEHRTEEAFALSHRVVVLEEGRILAAGTPKEVGEQLRTKNHKMQLALPTPMQIYSGVDNQLSCPITVEEGRKWLLDYQKIALIHPEPLFHRKREQGGEEAVQLQEVWFRYEKTTPDVLKGLSLSLQKGELLALLGGNGTGKSTALSLIAGVLKPYRGKVEVRQGKTALLPQNPQLLFLKKTVREELLEVLAEKDREEELKKIAHLCDITSLLSHHPYDLSGGEQQRTALAKVLLTQPDILLLDEPTKGMDASFKEEFAQILSSLKRQGLSILMVSHDLEFCARFADRCALLFDGRITSEGTPEAFFSGNSFYTTATSRMARNLLPWAILPEDVIAACGGNAERKKREERTLPSQQQEPSAPSPPKKKKFNLLLGGLFLLLFMLTAYFTHEKTKGWMWYWVSLLLGLELGSALFFLLPKRELRVKDFLIPPPEKKKGTSRRTKLATALVLIGAPLTIYAGYHFFDDRKYYFISLLLLLETFFLFFMRFEERKPQARELMVIAVLCAMGVAGRGVFYMLPQFKPVAALVILAGVCFGGEVGFLVGAITAFASNLFFGQGHWTPWQMFVFGLMGFLAGVVFQKGFLRATKGALCLFGGLTVLLLYGGIMNPASVLMSQAHPTWQALLTAYGMGFPMDVVHAASTVFFLWFLSEPLLTQLTRIQLKYGILRK